MIDLVLIWLTTMGFWYWFKRRHFVKLGSQIPGPRAYPLVGNALDFLGNPEAAFQRMRAYTRIYSRLMAIWFGPKLHVMLFDPRDVEVVLKSKSTVKSEEYKFLKPWLGESLLISEGKKFKQNKKLVWPVVQVCNLKRFLDTFNMHARDLVKNLQNEEGKEEFNVDAYLASCALDALMETFMGLKKETLGKKKMQYAKSVEKLGSIAHLRTYKFWLRPDFLFNLSQFKAIQGRHLNIVHSLTEKVIRERRTEYEKNKLNSVRNEYDWKVIVDALFAAKDENGYCLTDEDIKAEILTFMFAGTDTATTTLGFALCLLGLHQQVQAKVLEEIEELFGVSDRFVTYEDLSRLSYLDQVIKETLRLYPPVPLVGRRTTDDIKLETCTLPKDCSVGIALIKLHRNADQFPNPHQFNPDNFSAENVKNRHPYSYIPFSSGPRTCVGGKYAFFLIKVVLVTILRHYRVFSTRTEKQFHLSAQTVLRKKDGYLISLKARG